MFFADAARFACETIGFDAAWVLNYEGASSWREMACCGAVRPQGAVPDSEVLALLETNPVTWYQTRCVEGDPSQYALAAAPVLSPAGRLLGSVYALRDLAGANRRSSVRPFEARMLQVLAESVAVGITRLEHETKAARARVLLEQAFSPAVVAHLQQHPESLSGQLREVTLLFADLQGFTSLAESLAPDACYRLLEDVMEALTTAVVDQAGLVVDYFGDGLLAMWNAPLDQPQHADLACRAVQVMFAALPQVSAKWHSTLQSALELGVGIHTGDVLVGNAGTRSRLKYGPRGANVNLASRVQSATRQLKTSLLVTAATERMLSSEFVSLRVCTARLPGLEQPVDLFAVYPASSATELKSRTEFYARALQNYEAGNFREAEGTLRELLKTGAWDTAQFLAQQIAALRQAEPGRRAQDKAHAMPDAVIEVGENWCRRTISGR